MATAARTVATTVVTAARIAGTGVVEPRLPGCLPLMGKPTGAICNLDWNALDEPMRVLAGLLRRGEDATGIRDLYAARARRRAVGDFALDALGRSAVAAGASHPDGVMTLRSRQGRLEQSQRPGVGAALHHELRSRS